ncbi:MAG: DUF3352 domain-containing protein [Anaerolineae bacterium]|nr:DUF3352 domain-containing protein [Anaerolineae bacterium]
MRRAVILAVVFALVSMTVTPVGAQAVALASRPALSLAGAALIPDTFAGYIGLVGGEQLPQALVALRAYMGAPAEPDAVMQQVVDAIFPEGDIDYAADIAPWLGDQIALGVNPAGPDEEPDFRGVACHQQHRLVRRLRAEADRGLRQPGRADHADCSPERGRVHRRRHRAGDGERPCCLRVADGRAGRHRRERGRGHAAVRDPRL